MKKLLMMAVAVMGLMMMMAMASFEAMASGEPVVGLSMEQLERLRDIPNIDTRSASTREERNRPPDIEVEWEVVESYFAGEPRGSARAIFIDRDGIRLVTRYHPKYMRGARVWLSRDGMETWQVESEVRNATRETVAQMLGSKARARVIFPDWSRWPKKTEALIRERFLRNFQHRAYAIPLERAWPGRKTLFARDPIYPERLAFSTITRVFISLDNGKNWIELSAPQGEIRSLAINSRRNELSLFAGIPGRQGRLKHTVLELDQLRELKN